MDSASGACSKGWQFHALRALRTDTAPHSLAMAAAVNDDEIQGILAAIQLEQSVK
jgi:hypothetical protein